ncbi:MAG: endonuclease MutS2 [Deltaproteobacteria bacterium]|nr:endonuclease MutS2 [Deltaproteobacteria bacterium]
MDDTTLETLEFPAVLKELSLFCLTPIGRELALGLCPYPDIPPIEESFREYNEAASILKEAGRFPLAGVHDTRPLFSRAHPAGSYFLPEEIFQIRDNCDAAVALKSFLNPDFKKRYPLISARMDSIADERELVREIGRAFDENGQIKDDASSSLYSIRKELRSVREKARSLLDGFLNDRNLKEILQEELVTIRDDRYAFSVKAGRHTELPGVIHGRSNTGATYFVEPFGLVEINNRLAILRREEKAEEIEVLKALTLLILAEKEMLVHGLETMGAIDCLQAKALFAVRYRASVPHVKKGGGIIIKESRHPLLAVKEANGAGTAVPIDIRAGSVCRVLVISGANTGGKTVALKTLGLLTIMAMSGIPVTAAPESEVAYFTDIFADIGDRQDIIASLSTFSAHIKRVREFLSSAGAGSLVLIDEIGVGTDPVEGSALALSALETLRERGAVTVVTTHLNLLKARAQIDPAYMNASVEFNEETFKPLYRLHYGVPGASMGLSIAESLGIPHDVIERARSYLKEKEGAFVLSVRRLEEEKEEIRKIKERALRLEMERDAAIRRLKEERGLLLEKAGVRIEEMVMKAGMEIRGIIEKQRGGKAGGAASMRALREAGKNASERLKGRMERYVPSAGDKVAISGSNTKGVVVRVDLGAGRAELTAGRVKVWVDIDKLTRRGPEAPIRRGGKEAVTIDADIRSETSVNIIGMRVEEALPVVAKFLDNAHASGLDKVEIIHGVGTGRLAKAVAEYLGESNLVKGFHHGEQSRGGGGVTIAELE